MCFGCSPQMLEHGKDGGVRPVCRRICLTSRERVNPCSLAVIRLFDFDFSRLKLIRVSLTAYHRPRYQIGAKSKAWRAGKEI